MPNNYLSVLYKVENENVGLKVCVCMCVCVCVGGGGGTNIPLPPIVRLRRFINLNVFFSWI